MQSLKSFILALLFIQAGFLVLFTKGDLTSDIQSIQNSAFLAGHSGFAASAIIFPDGSVSSWFSGSGGDSKTKVRVGDLTKLFTATQMLRMRDASQLKLDAPLKEFFSNFPISSVTLRQLSTHMSGLGRQPPCKLFDCKLSSDEIIKAMNDCGLPGHGSISHDPYTTPIYSTFGYCWLSQALAKIGGESVPTTLKYIMSNAGMSNSGMLSELSSVSTVLAPSYGGNSTSAFDSELKSGWCEGAMDSYSTLEDLTKFIVSILQDEKLLSRQTVREFFTPQYIAPDASSATGFALEMSHDSKYNLWKRSKRGGVLGYSSHVIFVPEYKFGIVSLSTNRDVFATSLAEQIYTKAVGTLLQKYTLTLPSFTMPPVLSDYVGTYSCNADGSNATLYISGGHAVLNINVGMYVNFDLDYQPDNAFIIRDIQEAAYIPSLTMFKGGYGNEILRFYTDKTSGQWTFWMPGLDYYTAYTKISTDVNPQSRRSLTVPKTITQRKTSANPTCNILPNSVDIDISTLQTAITTLNNTMVERLAKKSSLKGSAIILAKYRDTVILNQGLGQVGTVGKETSAPTADSIFRVASVTKVFTSMAALIAQELGIIKSIDEPVTNYVQDFKYTNKYFTTASNKITFRQLMEHGAGLSRTSPCDPYNCNMTFSEYRKATVDLLQFIAPSISERFYSNVDFTILGRLLELITKKSFSSFVKTYIFDKLGMSNSGFDYTPDILSKMVVGRDPDYLTMLLAQEPAGGMYSSANDMLKFFSCFTYSSINSASACPIPVSKDAMRQFILPTFLANDASFTIGLGAFESMYDADNNYFFLTKGGSVYGYNAKPLVVPELDFVMITLASLNSPFANDIALANTPVIVKPLIEQIRKTIAAPSYPPALLSRITGNYSGYIDSWMTTGSLVMSVETLNTNQNLGSSSVIKGTLQQYGLSFYVVPVSQNGNVYTMKIKSNLNNDCATSTFSGLMDAPMVVDMSDSGITTISIPTLNFGNKFINGAKVSSAPRLFSAGMIVLFCMAILSIFC